MRHIISNTQVVATCAWKGQPVDVSARSIAEFDEDQATLHVHLSSAAEPADIVSHPDWQKPGWLPAPQDVVEHVSLPEALPAARSIFKTWTNKVREKIPA